MSKIHKNIKDQKRVIRVYFKDYWKKSNYVFLGISILVLIIGYYFMMDGSWDSTLSMSVSPVVLLIAYLILIPLSIFFKFPSKIKEKLSAPSKD